MSLAQQAGEEFRGHRGQVDGEDEDERRFGATQRGGDAPERTEAGDGILDDLDAGAGVRSVAAAGDEEFVRLERAEGGELALPERLAVDDERGFVAAHAGGAAAGEEHGGEVRVGDGHGVAHSWRTMSDAAPFRIKHLFISPGHNFFGHHGQPPGEHPMRGMCGGEVRRRTRAGGRPFFRLQGELQGAGHVLRERSV